jgi:DNA (cytosine-5)-methyltransferase 1
VRYVSLFSGIEAATVAWHPLGWEPLAFAEIDKFPAAVLAHRYPGVPNMGDVTSADWTKFKHANKPVDVVVFGSPCQSFSVAGKRLGLDDPRGNLALYALGVVRTLQPRCFVFENVPGLLSSAGGRDFGAFLGTVGDIGYRCAWRVLDAQHFGLAQRRKRVFVIGYLGDWRRAAAVLFERESLSGHPAPRREAGQVAPTVPSRRSAGGGLGTDFDCDGGLIAHAPPVSLCLNAGAMGRIDAESETLIPIGGSFDVAHALRADGFDASEDGTGRGTPIVPINLQIATRHQAMGRGTGFGVGEDGDPAFTISSAHSHAVAFNWNQSGDTALGMSREGVPPVRTKDTLAMLQGMQVRRLTPRECERLQGFPDDYTLIPYRGKPAADGPRYKALGNSMAVPVMRWIGRRIQLVDRLVA